MDVGVSSAWTPGSPLLPLAAKITGFFRSSPSYLHKHLCRGSPCDHAQRGVAGGRGGVGWGGGWGGWVGGAAVQTTAHSEVGERAARRSLLCSSFSGHGPVGVGLVAAHVLDGLGHVVGEREACVCSPSRASVGQHAARPRLRVRMRMSRTGRLLGLLAVALEAILVGARLGDGGVACAREPAVLHVGQGRVGDRADIVHATAAQCVGQGRAGGREEGRKGRREGGRARGSVGRVQAPPIAAVPGRGDRPGLGDLALHHRRVDLGLLGDLKVAVVRLSAAGRAHAGGAREPGAALAMAHVRSRKQT